MAGPAASIEWGFYVGIGVSLALLVWSLGQLLLGKAVHRSG